MRWQDYVYQLERTSTLDTHVTTEAKIRDLIAQGWELYKKKGPDRKGHTYLFFRRPRPNALVSSLPVQ